MTGDGATHGERGRLGAETAKSKTGTFRAEAVV